MIFKPNMIVVLTHGRLAGKKAVVLKELENGCLLVAGVNRVPKKSEEYEPAWQKRKNEKFLTFIKKINNKHALATRYKAEINQKIENISDAAESISAKSAANEEINKVLKSAFEEQKYKWLFTSLKF